MSIDAETRKLLRLRQVTQEYDEMKQILHNVWNNMQNFSKGLRNELDGQYWSESKIAFSDLEDVPAFNQYRFKYSDLEELFNIAYIKGIMDSFRKLSEEKKELEIELGVSMDRRP